MKKSNIKNQNYPSKISSEIHGAGKLNFKIFTFLIVILHFTFYILHSPMVHAQTFSLSLWPPLLEVMIQPGKSITQVYEVTNLSELPCQTTTQIASFEPADEYGNVTLKPRSGLSPIKFNFENADLALGESFTLAAGAKQQIVLKIKVPEGTLEDDYYFTLLFSSQTGLERKGLGSQEAGVIGSHLLLTVSESGKPLKKGQIVEFSTKKLLDTLEKPEFVLRVKNTGKAFWKPFGSIKVKGLVGQSFEIPLREDNVLAGSVRQIMTATGSASPKFLLGPYRATVEFSLDQEGEKLEKTISFLALPIKAVLGILIALLIILGIKSKKSFFKKAR